MVDTIEQMEERQKEKARERKMETEMERQLGGRKHECKYKNVSQQQKGRNKQIENRDKVI